MPYAWPILKWFGSFIKQNFVAILILVLGFFAYQYMEQRAELQRQEILRISEQQEFTTKKIDTVIDGVNRQIEQSTAKFVSLAKKELKPVIKKEIPKEILDEMNKKDERIVELEKQKILLGAGTYSGHAKDAGDFLTYKDSRIDFTMRKSDLFVNYTQEPISLNLLQYKTINTKSRSIKVKSIAYTDDPEKPVKTISKTYYVDKDFAVTEKARIKLFSGKHTKLYFTIGIGGLILLAVR